MFGSGTVSEFELILLSGSKLFMWSIWNTITQGAKQKDVSFLELFYVSAIIFEELIEPGTSIVEWPKLVPRVVLEGPGLALGWHSGLLGALEETTVIIIPPKAY